eukprot:1081128-Amorphochlora_amoeboformis.AAC.1
MELALTCKEALYLIIPLTPGSNGHSIRESRPGGSPADLREVSRGVPRGGPEAYTVAFYVIHAVRVRVGSG